VSSPKKRQSTSTAFVTISDQGGAPGAGMELDELIELTFSFILLSFSSLFAISFRVFPFFSSLRPLWYYDWHYCRRCGWWNDFVRHSRSFSVLLLPTAATQVWWRCL
jgi:hypothetical protein